MELLLAIIILLSFIYLIITIKEFNTQLRLIKFKMMDFISEFELINDKLDKLDKLDKIDRKKIIDAMSRSAVIDFGNNIITAKGFKTKSKKEESNKEETKLI